MERTHRLFALVAAAMLVTSAFGLGAVAGASAANTSGNTDLSVGVTQDDGVTVTVTDNGTAVDGAAVDVNATNGSYAGEGSYTTDNGTVSLASPEENVTVTVTATYDNDTASTTVDLVAENETDDNESDAFGERVSEYVHGVLTDGSIDRPGVVISQWVVENNPGNADPPAFDDNSTRGPPEDRGPDANETDDDDANETGENETERGPPEDAGPDGDKERGPPEDRGNDADDEDDSEEEAETEDEDDADDEDDTDDEEDEDDDGGPPEDRGNGNGNGR